MGERERTSGPGRIPQEWLGEQRDGLGYRVGPVGSWQPIQRGKVDVRGVHPQSEGLLDVRIILTASPPYEWKRIFDNPPDTALPESMHPPELFDREVKITPPDEQLESYVKHIDARIEEANRRYQALVLPREQKAQAQHEQEREANDARVGEARRRARDF